MSLVFYDNFLKLEKLEKKIKKISRDSDERSELTSLVDELIHCRILASILKILPREHHREFALIFSKNPADEKIIDFLRSKIKEDIAKIIHETAIILALEITGILTSYGKSKKL